MSIGVSFVLSIKGTLKPGLINRGTESTITPNLVQLFLEDGYAPNFQNPSEKSEGKGRKYACIP